jgi:hypothetical protein
VPAVCTGSRDDRSHSGRCHAPALELRQDVPTRLINRAALPQPAPERNAAGRLTAGELHPEHLAVPQREVALVPKKHLLVVLRPAHMLTHRRCVDSAQQRQIIVGPCHQPERQFTHEPTMPATLAKVSPAST